MKTITFPLYGLLFCLFSMNFSLGQGDASTKILIKKFQQTTKRQLLKTQLSSERGLDDYYNFQETDNGLPDKLKKKYPEIRTYRGVSSTNPNVTSYVTVVNNKIFGGILSGTSITTFINEGKSPSSRLSFEKDKILNCGDCKNGEEHRCAMPDVFTTNNQDNSLTKIATSTLKQTAAARMSATAATSLSHGSQYRIFRLAMVLSYWQNHELGFTTVAEGLAYANTRVTLFNDVFGKELAVNFQLVPNNDLLILLDPSDPFPEAFLPSNANEQFGNTKTVLNAVIGVNNYDWGFLMHPSGTGWAGGNYCGSGKHAGVANGPDWGLMLHEMGHMFGCPHAYHLDGSVDIPSLTRCIVGGNGGRWFHSINFEIAAANLDAAICGTTGLTGNTPPNITMPLTSGFSIPKSTPFVLSASATDPDATAALTYSWQHTNVTPSEEAAPTPAGRLIWAYPNPSATENVRHIPSLASQIANMPDINVILPTVSRPIVTRFIVRDNQVPYGAVAYKEISFNVDATAGPFLVSYPNTNVSVTGGQNMTVTWDVANTNNATVNAQNVNILLSTDEAATWTTLASNVPNNGSYTLTLPNTPSTKCRIKVEAAGNIFYDMSNVNFTIIAATTNDFVFIPIDNYNAQYDETSSTFQFNFTKVGVFTNNVNVTYSGIPSGASITTPTQLTASGDFNVVLQNTNAVAPGKYPITITLTEVGGTGITKSLVFTFVKKTTGSPVAGNAFRVVQEDKALLATTQNLTTNTFTLAGWVKPTQTGRSWYRSGLLFFGEHTGIFINPAGQLGYIFNDLYAVENLTSVAFNQWNHVVLVVASDRATLYLNGVKVGEKVMLHSPINLGTTLKIGKREWYATVFGDYDEVKIFKKSLTENEVREEMHRNIDYQNPELLHYYQFNEASGNPFSPVSFDATVMESSTSKVVSTVPSGTADVKTLPQSSTVTDFTGTDINLKFTTSSATNLATVHKIKVSPNTLGGIPITQINLTPNAYWEINTYPSTTAVIPEVVFKVGSDLVNTDANTDFVLYRRDQTSFGNWTLVGSATSFNPATETVTFQNIPSTGQYIVYKLTNKVIELLEVDATVSCFLTPTNNKTFQYSVKGTALTDPINISFTNSDFLVSTSPTSGFATSLAVSPANGTVQPIYAKYAGTAYGSFAPILSVSSTGAATQMDTLKITFTKDSYGRGNAMVFDGANDKVNITGLTWQPTKFTVEFWYKPNNSFFSYNHWIGNTNQFFMHSDYGKYIKIGTANTTASTIVTTNDALVANKWVHIAYTFNQGTASLYLNGKLYQTKTGVVNPNAWSSFSLGKGDNNSLNGMLDEFRVWSEARTEQQIQENMHLINDLKTACTDGLKLYYQFENNTGGVIEDATGSYHATISDNPTIAVSSVPVGFGKAQTNDVTAAGNYTFPNANATINFSGTIPNGKIVVSQISDTPFAAPTTTGTLFSKYWVIDNYGTNTGLTANVTFTPTSGFITSTSPTNYAIYKRGSNDFGAWLSAVNPTAMTGTALTLNGISSFSQFSLANVTTFCTQLSYTAPAVSFTKVGITTQEPKRINFPEDLPNGFIALESQNKGFVITRLTTAQINALTPIEGMLVYNTDANCFQLWNGTSWKCIERSCNN